MVDADARASVAVRQTMEVPGWVCSRVGSTVVAPSCRSWLVRQGSWRPGARQLRPRLRPRPGRDQRPRRCSADLGTEQAGRGEQARYRQQASRRASDAIGRRSAPGRALIGEWEGPEVVVDSARFPKSFAESPLLAQLVKAGKLPPVAERVGQDPLVVKPVHEIGKYGGTWRRGFTGPGDKWNGYRAATGPDNLLFWDYTGETRSSRTSPRAGRCRTTARRSSCSCDVA